MSFSLLRADGALAVGTPPSPPKKPSDAPLSTSSSSQVTLPLTDYQQLSARPAVTVVETLRIEGSFEPRSLMLTLTGRTAGTGPTVEVLSTAAGARLWGCEGDAILSRSGSDKYELTPLQPRFRCAVRSRAARRGQASAFDVAAGAVD